MLGEVAFKPNTVSSEEWIMRHPVFSWDYATFLSDRKHLAHVNHKTFLMTNFRHWIVQFLPKITSKGKHWNTYIPYDPPISGQFLDLIFQAKIKLYETRFELRNLHRPFMIFKGQNWGSYVRIRCHWCNFYTQTLKTVFISESPIRFTVRSSGRSDTRVFWSWKIWGRGIIRRASYPLAAIRHWKKSKFIRVRTEKNKI